MPAYARRNWSEIKAEAIRRLGGRDEPGFDQRVESWLRAAHVLVGLLVHHFELNVLDESVLLVQGAMTADLPEATYSVAGVGLVDAAGDFAGWVENTKLQHLQAAATDAPGKPREYTRWGSTLVFDRPADAEYRLRLFLYRTPAPPDFNGAEAPELGELWDQVLVEVATAIGCGAVWRPDLAQAIFQLAAQLQGEQPQSRPKSNPIADVTETPAPTLGGAQG